MGRALSEHRFIEVDGATLRVSVAGEGPVVVLVHGWALDLDMWRAQIDFLSPWYRVVAFDRRGFGLSSGEPGIEQDVLDVERLLDRLFDRLPEGAEVGRVAVVGMSQGARVALRWALRHPDRTACLVLDAPPAEGLSQPRVGEEIPLDDYRGLIRGEGIEAFRRLWRQHPFMRLHAAAASAQQLLGEIAARYSARDLLTDEPVRMSPLRERDLKNVDVPTLVLSGEYDTQQRRSIARGLAAALPDAQLKTVMRAGHLAALDEPETYAQLLHEFFAMNWRTRWPAQFSK